MPLPGGYILDTNIILAHLRQNDLGRYIDATYGLLAPIQPLHVAIVTVGELYALANKFNWGPTKLIALDALIADFDVSNINDQQILVDYGDIDGWSFARGHKMGKNDLWIAAVSRVANRTILTTDTDFDHIHGHWVDREWVDPNSKLPP